MFKLTDKFMGETLETYIDRTLKFRSWQVQRTDRPARRALLHPAGLTESDFDLPFIQVAAVYDPRSACNMHLERLVKIVASGVRQFEMVDFIAQIGGINDGKGMGGRGQNFNRNLVML